MGVMYSQIFPPPPTLTEANLPRQDGKVFIVTGGASGIGFELCAILYQAGGKVYMAGRSETNAQSAILKIKALPTKSPGELHFLPLSLHDLTSIKPTVEAFTAAESRLDVLFNNAGVSLPPRGSISTQGHELTIATNCLGPYLLTQLLLPTLLRTAASTTPGAVRVVWSSSMVVDTSAPTGGIVLADLGTPYPDPQKNYTDTKTGNWFLASELAAQVGSKGVLSVTQNPGNLNTSLFRHAKWLGWVFWLVLFGARMGAYTELWAGLSGELGIGDGGVYVLPWGRKNLSPRADLVAALKTQEEGGTGVAAKYVEYCERVTEGFR